MGSQGWRNAVSQLLWVYGGPLPKNGNGRQNIATDYYAWLLLSGEAHFSFEKKADAVLRAGCWGFPPPLAAGRFHRFSSDARLISLHFRVEQAGGRLPFEMNEFVSFESSRHPGLEREAAKLVKLAKGLLDSPLNSAPRDYGFRRHAAIQTSFWRWLSLWEEAFAAEGVKEAPFALLDERVERMLDVLKGVREYGSVPYKRLREASSLGRVQIDRLFKEQLGASPKRVLERQLLELCKERLRSSNVSAKELSSEFGFRHPANFCAWFAKGSGLPPQRFRERD